jgi:hypothetical protein
MQIKAIEPGSGLQIQCVNLTRISSVQSAYATNAQSVHAGSGQTFESSAKGISRYACNFLYGVLI